MTKYRSIILLDFVKTYSRTKNYIVEKLHMERFYRQQFKTDGLYSFRVQEAETDILIICDADLERMAKSCVIEARKQIESCIKEYPLFETSLEPVSITGCISPIPLRMIKASQIYGVGPMAAVAGAVAQFVGEELSPHCSHLIVENGGDICLKSYRPVTLSIYPGEQSIFRDKLNFKLVTGGKLMGVCTSSATVGHSLSFGKADAVVTVADKTEIADAAATALCNRVKSIGDMEKVINDEVDRGVLKSLVIVMEDKTGAWGDLEFI
jgi:uncharacterized protein